MPDERQDSIRHGLHSPEESPSGAAAERERQRRLAEEHPVESGMGGSSDASRPGDEAQMNAARTEAEAADGDSEDLAERPGGG